MSVLQLLAAKAPEQGARKSLGELAQIALGALMLCAPAILNGFPFVFFDTAQYFEFGAAVARLLGLADPSGADAGSLWLTTLGNRSIFYSAPLYALVRGAGFWSIAALQALSGAWLLAVFVRASAPPRPLLCYYGLILALILTSTLSFFASFVMPDIFTGYLVLAAALLLFYRAKLSARQQAGLIALIFYACTAHVTNLLLVFAFTMLGACAWAVPAWRSIVRNGSPIAIAALAAVLALVAANAATSAAAGAKLRSPPFLMAHLIEAGPGRDYLRTHCSPAKFAVCAFRDRDLSDHNKFLWSSDPRTGVFLEGDDARRRALSDEEAAFAAAVVTAYPLQTLAASLHEWLGQLRELTIGYEFTAQRDVWLDGDLARDAPQIAAPFTSTIAFAGRAPFAAFQFLQKLVLVLALGFIVLRGASADWRRALFAAQPSAEDQNKRALTAAIALVLAAIVVNAAICGILSGVHQRYGARLSWLIPAFAMIMALRFGLRVSPPLRAKT